MSIYPVAVQMPGNCVGDLVCHIGTITQCPSNVTIIRNIILMTLDRQQGEKEGDNHYMCHSDGYTQNLNHLFMLFVRASAAVGHCRACE